MNSELTYKRSGVNIKEGDNEMKKLLIWGLAIS